MDNTQIRELNNKELQGYIGILSEIEGEAYTLKEAIGALYTEINKIKRMKEPVLRNIPKPVGMDSSFSTKVDDEIQEKKVTIKILIGIGLIIIVIPVVLRLLSGNPSKEHYYLMISGICIGSVLLGLAAIKHIDVTRDENINNALKQKYYRSQAEKKDEYEKDVAAEKRYYERYSREYTAAQSRLTPLENEVSVLIEIQEKVNNTLNSLYEANIIFPKYRNLAAISTIHEYLASGRCMELTGPNGAYNLYETELRQNIVISNLESINDNLDIIKNNQYTLYHQIENTNHFLRELNRNISDISSNIDAISDNSEKTAKSTAVIEMQTKIIEKNTEAIKWINLLT